MQHRYRIHRKCRCDHSTLSDMSHNFFFSSFSSKCYRTELFAHRFSKDFGTFDGYYRSDIHIDDHSHKKINSFFFAEYFRRKITRNSLNFYSLFYPLLIKFISICLQNISQRNFSSGKTKVTETNWRIYGLDIAPFMQANTKRHRR